SSSWATWGCSCATAWCEASSPATHRPLTKGGSRSGARSSRLSPVGILVEDRRYRGVDSLLGLRATHAVQTLLDRGVPQRLPALRVVEIHRDDAFAVHVGPRAPPPIRVTPAVGVVGHRVRADAVAHQTIRVARDRLNAARQVRSNRGAEPIFVHGIRDRVAQRTLPVERARPRERVALHAADQGAIDVRSHVERRARCREAEDGCDEAGAEQMLQHERNLERARFRPPPAGPPPPKYANASLRPRLTR